MAFTPMTPSMLPRTTSPVCPGAPVKKHKTMMRMKPYTPPPAICSPAPRVVDIPPFDPYTGNLRFDMTSNKLFREFMEEKGRIQEFGLNMYDIVRPFGTANYTVALMMTPGGLRESISDMVTMDADDIFVIPHDVTDEVDIIGFLGKELLEDSNVYCEVTSRIFYHTETGYRTLSTNKGPYRPLVSMSRDDALCSRQKSVIQRICGRLSTHEKNTVVRAFLHWQTIYTTKNPYGGPREAADYEWNVLEKGGFRSMVQLSTDQKAYFTHLLEETKEMIEKGECDVREVRIE